MTLSHSRDTTRYFHEIERVDTWHPSWWWFQIQPDNWPVALCSHSQSFILDHLYKSYCDNTTDSYSVSMQQLKHIYRERQVAHLCQNLCYQLQSDYLSELVSRTLPNIRKLYDLSHAVQEWKTGRSDTDRYQPAHRAVVSFSILYRAVHDKPELTDVEVELCSTHTVRSPSIFSRCFIRWPMCDCA